MTIELRTKSGQKQTEGGIYIDGVKFCDTIELPWKKNKRGISCIPDGSYTVVKRAAFEKRPYEHFHVKDVPGRSWILIHRGNYVRQIKGCILPGLKLTDLDGDGLKDVVNSTAALEALLNRLPKEFTMVVKRE